MATTPKTKIGHIPCLCCGAKIPVKQAENGTMNVSCNECDFTGYVKQGSEAHAKIAARVIRAASAAPAPAPAKPAPAPAPTMATAPVSKKNTIFG